MRFSLTTLFGLVLGAQLCLFSAVHAQEPSKLSLPQLTLDMANLEYPEPALKTGMQGRVLVAFSISKRGKVQDPTVVAAEPAGEFETMAIKAVKQVKFTVPRDWDDTGGTQHRFQLSVLFKLNPCVEPACIAPKPHDEADDFLIISAQVPH